jgi:hypothetical protein
LDHRSSVRAVRALAEGEDAFVSALERAPGFDAADFESFLTRHQLRDWVAPAFLVAVNVFAVFFTLWGCAGEFPSVAGALGRRLRLVELSDAEEAAVLVERPRGSPGNRLWFHRVYPRSPSRYWAWRLTRDLPHTLARLQPSRGVVLAES